MILAARLSVEDEDLMHVGRSLEEVVQLERAGERRMRVPKPHLRKLEWCRGEVVVDVLNGIVIG